MSYCNVWENKTIKTFCGTAVSWDDRSILIAGSC